MTRPYLIRWRPGRNPGTSTMLLRGHTCVTWLGQPGRKCGPLTVITTRPSCR